MEYERRQRIYKTIMTIALTTTITMIATVIALYKFWGEHNGVKYVMLPSSNNDQLSSEVSRIKSMIDKYYLGEINEEDLIDGALEGYVRGLGDEYSEYISKKDRESFTENTMGNYDGIGIYFGRLISNNKVVIIAPIKETPAYNAGIQPGDIINKIDDEEIKEDESLTNISNRIKGKPGTKVKLTIERKGEIKEFEIERANIKLHYIDAEVLDGNIGYMEISSFDEGTADEFINKYNELNQKGIRALIIDLRNNGGGIVEEATKIADRILKKDTTIVTLKDKNGNEEVTKAKTEETINIPIILLTNGNSASASEILAGALKDNNAAKIIGEKTYGKGVIQNVYFMTNGSALKLTTNEYFTPNNNRINHVGIEPDIEVKLPEELEDKYIIEKEEDTQLQKAIEIIDGLQN